MRLDLIIIWLLQKLYPTARAWRMPPPRETGSYVTDENGTIATDEAGNPIVTEDFTVTGGFFYRLHRALAIQFQIAWMGATGTQDFQLPDNANFTIQDCHDWYRRLGIYDSGLVSRANMILAIKQWWSHFNSTLLNKQNWKYIQDQLQAAGFNVNVYENRFLPGPTTKTPAEVLGLPTGRAYYGNIDYGEADYGEDWSTSGISICANYLEAAKDEVIAITNWRSTFYIADPGGITTFATIPAGREIEFRQLLIKLKNIQTIGILFVNYT